MLTPNTGAWPTAGVTLGGTTFVNLGLQGVGRVAANSIDSATGETLGSISDMQITGFTNNGNGSWSGTFNFLPDRGYNWVASPTMRAHQHLRLYLYALTAAAPRRRKTRSR
ncbi:MAG: hypothetical protein IPP85_13825 [Propionivibrio sp.]|nr:hypothetical protein [Propionivibrio sp.]